MKLVDWLKETKTTQEDFAIELGVRQQSVSDWCAGAPPKRNNALKIVKATKGKVSLADLWPDVKVA